MTSIPGVPATPHWRGAIDRLSTAAAGWLAARTTASWDERFWRSSVQRIKPSMSVLS